MLFSSTNFTNFVTISYKNNWESLYFHKIVCKKTLNLLKVTQNQSPDSMSCWAWGSHVRQWIPEMSRQICNQHWIRGEGVRVLQFLSLIVGEIPPPQHPGMCFDQVRFWIFCCDFATVFEINLFFFNCNSFFWKKYEEEPQDHSCKMLCVISIFFSYTKSPTILWKK